MWHHSSADPINVAFLKSRTIATKAWNWRNSKPWPRIGSLLFARLHSQGCSMGKTFSDIVDMQDEWQPWATIDCSGGRTTKKHWQPSIIWKGTSLRSTVSQVFWTKQEIEKMEGNSLSSLPSDPPFFGLTVSDFLKANLLQVFRLGSDFKPYTHSHVY